MPILDPNLMASLYETYIHPRKRTKAFFFYYLKTASKNIFKNLDTIKASIRFKNDLKNSISFINKHFGCNFNIDDFNKPIKDFYRFFYDSVDDKYKIHKITKKLKGEYMQHLDTNTKFFMPFNEYTDYYWYLTNSPIAILCLQVYYLKNKNLDDMINYIRLEADLLLGSGYTLVLCFGDNVSDKIKFRKIIDMIKTHNFSEIHFIYNSSMCLESDFDFALQCILDNIDQFHSYFYFYSSNHQRNENKYLFKSLKAKPFFKYFLFSTSTYRAFKSCDLTQISPFVYCKSGFDKDKIFITLFNVPLYNTDDEILDPIPSQMSNIARAYISKNDFFNWNKTRVKILLDNEFKNKEFCYKYVNFDDIHLIRPDLFVSETLYLTKSKENILKCVMNIINESDKKIKNEKFKKEHIYALFNNKFQKGMAYMAYAYSMFQNKQFNKNFKIHKNQVFTALEACKMILNNQKNSINKGMVYQLETGEGKSCIICMIAAFLALMKKTVHIASSNISLAIRDYYESYKFFKQLDLSSAVLLHSNELPVKVLPKNNKGKVKNADDKKTNENDDIYENNEFKYNPKFFPRQFFRSKLFKNSSNMNFSVCGMTNENELSKDKANVIFSTFVNYESLYLRMMEMCPGYIKPYFNECALIIDEADSILIDELTNGTILSRTMKTNGKKVLKYIYDSYTKENKKEDEIYQEVKEKWPECQDIKVQDILDMFKEIDLVNESEFTDGKKYSIETIKKEVKKTYEEIKDQAISTIKNKISDNLTNKNESNKDMTATSDNKKNIRKGKDKKKSIIKDIFKKEVIYKEIVPFDYDNKGVLEPNKEFSGFIQQFIAIKEIEKNKENENIKIKDVSMNYLYVSHPIFIELYKSVCGLTGTIGNKYDKNILKERYNLTTKKIARENPNLMVEFPPILCNNIKERNENIVKEIIQINAKELPVLVIFQDLNEISDVLKSLNLKGIKNINIFDGKDDKIKPNKLAGLKGAVSLGTNVCGRGTDIKPVLPLHVIVSYYTSNSRVVNQAFGRTARQGNEGTVRIICLKDQFISPIRIFNNKDVNYVLNEFQYKNDMQRKFIERFAETRKWIFSANIESQIFSDDDIAKMRQCRININRIKVCKFRFPICISILKFLNIQAQKIFSLYNCPNCRYTWMIFQKYVREMILESWSLFVDKIEREYYRNKVQESFKDYLSKEIDSLYCRLFIYLPENKNPKQNEIVPTFMHIFNKVRKQYEERILRIFPEKLRNFRKGDEGKRYVSFNFGFRPFSLIDESGARINSIDGEEQEQTFIKDPELKYYRKRLHHKNSILSITEKIDDIFDLILQKINEKIGSNIGLRLFLRRTLGGCEFGICYDFDIECADNSIVNDKNCLVDKDPLLCFTISVKSLIPVLAGILIIVLVYTAKLIKDIFELISPLGIKQIVKVTLKEIVSILASDKIDQLFGTLHEFIQNLICAQIEKMKQYKEDLAFLFQLLLDIAMNKEFEKSGDKINSLFEGKVKTKSKFANSVITDNLSGHHFFKTGMLIMLCIAAFATNFYFNRQSLTYYKDKYNSDKVSYEYDKKVAQIEQKTINESTKKENVDQKIREECKREVKETLDQYETIIKY